MLDVTILSCALLLCLHQSEGLAKIILCRQRYKQKEIRSFEEAASKSEEESDKEVSEEPEEEEARVAVCSRETAFFDSRIRKLVVQIEPISAAVARYAAVAALGRNRVNVNASKSEQEVMPEAKALNKHKLKDCFIRVSPQASKTILTHLTHHAFSPEGAKVQTT